MFGSRQSIVNQWRSLRLTVAREVSGLLGAALFPPRCCLCGFEGQAPDLDLCLHCEADLPWDESITPQVLTALRFEPPADDMVRRLKYAGDTTHARVLGEMLARAARRRNEPLPRLLVPAPLHDARVRERGFNQALSLARFAGRRLGIPFSRHLLLRVRDTPSQTGLDRSERRRNVHDAFAITDIRARRRLLSASHVAVVDDVTTTGSTLAEIRRLLLDAGVRRVDLWAVARAP